MACLTTWKKYLRDDVIYNIFITTPEIERLHGILYLIQKIMIFQWYSMAILNIRSCNYQIILSINKLSWVDYFIHVIWNSYNFYNLSPWRLSCLNYLFRLIYVTEFKQVMDITYSFCQGKLRNYNKKKMDWWEKFNIILEQHTYFISQSVYNWCSILNQRRSPSHR